MANNFTFLTTPLEGVIIVEARSFKDERGFFMESYTQREFAAGGIAEIFVQDNHSCSRRGVIRGLHFQSGTPQGKLVRVAAGSVLDVAVDLRYGSPDFGKWFSVELSAQNARQLYIPAGFAHGYLSLEDHTHLMYKCTQHYAPGHDKGITWDDPDIAIDWRIGEFGLTAQQLILSPKDRELPLLRGLNPDDLK